MNSRGGAVKAVYQEWDQILGPTLGNDCHCRAGWTNGEQHPHQRYRDILK